MAFTPQQMTRLASHVWQGPDYVTFALLDGAGIPDLLDRLYGVDSLEFECLYSGELEPDVAEVAPYIARLEQGSGFAAWVLAGWGASRGIFAQVTEDVRMPQLRRHFRKLYMVYGDDGKRPCPAAEHHAVWHVPIHAASLRAATSEKVIREFPSEFNNAFRKF
jgi:hypothetical protein